MASSSQSVRRLYQQFKPTHYDLKLQIHPEAMTFSGTVIIEGEKHGRPSKRLTLHQKNLKISAVKATYQGKDGESSVSFDRVNNHAGYDEVRLHSKALLRNGEYKLELEFAGKISEQMNGIYPCYFEHNGKQKKLIATQFESHHAREVFPCIDEPEAKATFDLNLTTPIGQEVLANTPIRKQTTSKDLLVTGFETTPVMSTYLLAFVIGEIHCVEATSNSGLQLRTWGTVTQPRSSLIYANEELKSVLEFFTGYFQTPFPLKKLDQVALPDFESGAMENWGLITYREIALLTDAKNRSLSSEQYVSMVVSHEVSHQWFGNLVTMKWWDDLWLNESFASLMEHIALDYLHPDWQQWETFMASDVIACSNRDIFKDVQPVRVDVRHPDEIGTLFDPAIVYAKGGRLLKMLREYIGDEAFRNGLKAYFKRHAYQNTTRDDLWAALSKASGENVQKFMNPWLEQSGMPMVTLTMNKDRQTLATQERFVLDAKDDKQLWPIATLSEGVSPTIFHERQARLTTSKHPLVLNEHGSGHYIVNYGSGELKQAVDESFAAHELLNESRINYLNDLLLLARRGDISISEVLSVVARSDNEPRDAVWSLMARTIGLAHSLIEDDEAAHKQLNSFRVQIAQDWHQKLGWDETSKDDANTKLLRQTILGLTLGGEDKASVDEAINRYQTAKTADKLDAGIRPMILGAIIKNKPQNYLATLISEYKSTANPEVQMAISSGLTSLKDKQLGKDLINQAMGNNAEGFVRFQDIFRWFALLMRNRHLRDLTWGWFVANWDRLYKQFGSSKSMDNFVVYAAAPLNTPEWQTKFNDFFKNKRNIVALKRNIIIAESEIDARVQWRKRDEKPVKKFLKDH